MENASLIRLLEDLLFHDNVEKDSWKIGNIPHNEI